MTLPFYRSVSDAVMAVVRFNAKTMTEIANEMGWSVDQLSRATDPSQKPRFAAEWIVPVTLTTGDFAIVRTICKLVGGVFFQPRRSTSHSASTAKSLQEFSDYLAKYAKHEAKGFTKEEAEDIENEVHQAIDAMLCHVDKLKAEAR